MSTLSVGIESLGVKVREPKPHESKRRVVRVLNKTVKALQVVFDRDRVEGFCLRNSAGLIMSQYGDKDVREPFTP